MKPFPQLTLSFPVHPFENNPISQSFLDSHRDLFAMDCFEVLKVLVNEPQGLTVRQAMDRNLSGHLPSRIRDLSNVKYGNHLGIPISREAIQCEYSNRKVQRYYMTTADKAKAMEIIMGRLR